MRAFEQAAMDAVGELGAVALGVLADRVVAGWPEDALLAGMGPAFAELARTVVRARERDSVPPVEAGCFLRGLAAGYARQDAETSVQTVWSGPSSHAVPVRSMAQALTEVVAEASGELLVMTYAATSHEPIRDALATAIARGVGVHVVVETLQGARGALAGAEPATAFAGIRGVQLWHWPVRQRAEAGSMMHAKLAIADRRTLLVSSANLTQSGVGRNIEAGVLVRGGSAPIRAAEHISQLQAKGVLERLSVSGYGAR